ncbi:MAG: 50S ribosomal protein L11 methyltransferase [Nitrospirota bacterium]
MFIQFKITLPSALREPVTAVLYDIGCEGIEEKDDALIAYFPDSAGLDGIKDALSQFDGLSFSSETVEEKDWQAAWKERFECVRAAGFLICPPWKAPDDSFHITLPTCGGGKAEGRVGANGPSMSPSPLAGEGGTECRDRVILIDPGNAFGAGDHITTLTVLKLLRKWADEQNNLSGKSLLDIGTGTGILAIAARLIGVGGVTAVDTDISSVEAAEKNLALNGITGGMRVIHGSLQDADAGRPAPGRYDIVLANIFLEPLLELMRPISAVLKPGGTLIISGLLEGQEEAVLKEAARYGLSLSESIVSVAGLPAWFSAVLSRTR